MEVFLITHSIAIFSLELEKTSAFRQKALMRNDNFLKIFGITISKLGA
jgi:hypothetical protein